ncbi:MAG: nicotinate-nucleotide adenylyltransferase [Filomicrobium sp.]
MTGLPSATQRSSFAVTTPPVWPGARIGLMGGSFNPPHEGHLIVARTAIRRLRLDRLWWVVTPGNPLKENNALPTTDKRIEAIEAMANHTAMITTDFECQLGTSYTAQTIRFLKRQHPAANFVWIMGADNLATFHRWQRWKEIATTLPIAVVDRPDWRFKALASPAARYLKPWRYRERKARAVPALPAPAWVFLSTRLSNQSSTALRAKAKM